MPPRDDLVRFAPHILTRTDFTSWQDQNLQNREMLSHALNLRDTIAFAGAGCSCGLDYPTWNELAAEAIKLTEERRSQTSDCNECDAYLNDIKQTYDGTPRSPRGRDVPPGNRRTLMSADLMFILGGCERIWERYREYDKHRTGQQPSYRERLAELFKHRESQLSASSGLRGDHNPYNALVQLPVHRFVTSNYDCELENALLDSDKAKDKTEYLYPLFRKGGTKNSFTQAGTYDEQLAGFAMAFTDYVPRVFHCHGWYHEPEDMVLTEADYQLWYLKDQAIGGGRYRQTIDLIFGSNPMLFVGFSLRDDDLLFALRVLSAAEPGRKHSREVFALLENDGFQNESHFRQLYDRYGVHVISYKQDPNLSNMERANALTAQIKEILKACNDHRAEWLRKPKLRTLESQMAGSPSPQGGTVEGAPSKVLPKAQYLQYKYDWNFQDLPKDDQLSEIHASLAVAPRVVTLVGSGGTGKSWKAMRLLLDCAIDQQPPFSGYFFWSSYYSDDALSGIDQALHYMGAPFQQTKSRLELLRECLCTSPWLLVFDGIERFVCETQKHETYQYEAKETPEIRGITTFVDHFFEVIADERSQSTVVLTSQMMPTYLASIGDPRVMRFNVQGFNEAQAAQCVDDQLDTQWSKLHQESSKPDPAPTEDVIRMVSWLGGHRYGITLAASWLAIQGRYDKERSQLLLRKMAEADPDRRLAKMIELSIEDLEQSGPEGRQAVHLLERLAVLMEPFNQEVVVKCLEDDRPEAISTDALLRSLIERQLIFRVYLGPEKTPLHHIVHPTVREYIFRHRHHSLAPGLPNLTLSGYTSGKDTVYPGNGIGVALTRELLQRFENAARSSMRAADTQEASQYCRNFFEVVRSRMVGTAAPRWTTYSEYLTYLVRLIDLAREISRPQNGLWDYASRGSRLSVFEDTKGVLYPDELAWLYNEAGLAYYGQGSMMDAKAVWEQAYEINKLLDVDPNDGHYVFQSWCNLGAANIHFGRLRVAESYFKRALVLGEDLGEDDHVARIEGYLALLRHLQGNLAEAHRRYNRSTRVLRRVGNMRALSIVLRHHGDLLIKREKFDEAKAKIQESGALAEAGRYPELVAYARLSKGHLARSQNAFQEAIHEDRAALFAARSIGIGRLEAEAHSELARIALDLGDFQIARRRAMRTLQIANEHVLGLRQTHGMVILGKATFLAGQRSLGVSYLQYAKKLAELQEYRLRESEAEAALYEWSEPMDDWDVEPVGMPSRSQSR